MKPENKNLITALGIVVGLFLGFCYWWFVSRRLEVTVNGKTVLTNELLKFT
ncbi:MAG: hypothetical protein AB2L20_28590 [Mangrovibacterium sp.]